MGNRLIGRILTIAQRKISNPIRSWIPMEQEQTNGALTRTMVTGYSKYWPFKQGWAKSETQKAYLHLLTCDGSPVAGILLPVEVSPDFLFYAYRSGSCGHSDLAIKLMETVNLSLSEMETIHFFQTHFFSDLKRKSSSNISSEVLSLEQLFEPPELTTSMLVVPLKDGRVNWSAMFRYKAIRELKAPVQGEAEFAKDDVVQSRGGSRSIYVISAFLPGNTPLDSFFDVVSREFELDKRELITEHYGIDPKKFEARKKEPFLAALAGLELPKEIQERLLLGAGSLGSRMIPTDGAESVLLAKNIVGSNSIKLNKKMTEQPVTVECRSKHPFFRLLSASQTDVWPLSLAEVNRLLPLPSFLANFVRFYRTSMFARIYGLQEKSSLLYLKAFSQPMEDSSLNYEALETLGDTVLKFLLMAFFFVAFESESERQLTEMKRVLLSNLFYSEVANRMGLQNFMVKPNVVDELNFPLFTERKESESTLSLTRKTLGDIFEATAAVYFLNHKTLNLLFDLLAVRFDLFALSQNQPFVCDHRTSQCLKCFADSWQFRSEPAESPQPHPVFTQPRHAEFLRRCFKEPHGHFKFERRRPHFQGLEGASLENLAQAFEKLGIFALGNRREQSCSTEETVHQLQKILGRPFPHFDFVVRALSDQRTFERYELFGDMLIEFVVVCAIGRYFEKHKVYYNPQLLQTVKILFLSNNAMKKFCVFFGFWEFVKDSETNRHIAKTILPHFGKQSIREFLQLNIEGIGKHYSDFWEVLCFVVFHEGGFEAVDELILSRLSPFLLYFVDNHMEFEGMNKMTFTK